MSQIPNTNQISAYYPQLAQNSVNAPQGPAQNQTQQTPQVATPNPGQIYQYPTTSLYDPNQKQAASGVNIVIYNPMGLGMPGSNGMPQTPQVQVVPQTPIASSPITNNDNSTTNNINNTQNPVANTPINDGNGDVKANSAKPKVNLNDDYIKTLENYLRSADENVRKDAIVDLIKRYEEDNSRYDNPSLTALLNIALQDPSKDNRMLAMSPIAAGEAHGDANTIKLLEELQQSKALYGQEAKMAADAALKAAQNR